MHPKHLESEKMECDGLETARGSILHKSLKIRIRNFSASNSTKKYPYFFKDIKFRYFHNNVKFIFKFHMRVNSNGFNERTEGWLTVVPDIKCLNFNVRHEDHGVLTCTVSMVDIKGNRRFPRSFQRDYAEEEDFGHFTRLKHKKAIEAQENTKYFKRAFILDRAEEFLLKDVLTLRCDFCTDLSPIISFLTLTKDKTFPLQLSRWIIKKAQTGDRSDSLEPKQSEEFYVYDYTSQVLTLPQFDEARKRFGVYGSSRSTLKINSGPKEDGADTFEHIWMFDILGSPSQRILLSLDERQDSLGTRLLTASPVIRRMVETDMRERQEKCIELLDVKGQTFRKVLEFLEYGPIGFKLKIDQVMDVYVFSHFYDMKDLQRICAESIVKLFEVDEIEKIIDMYSDQYLSGLLESRRLNLEESQLKMDDIPYSYCYI